MITQLFSHPEIAIIQLFLDYGMRIYAIMFVEYYIESAFVVVSFLPRDGILFMIWALSLQTIWDDIVGQIDIDIVLQTMILAGIVWDVTSYFFGKLIGEHLIWKSFSVFGHQMIVVQETQVQKTQKFIEQYGYKAILFGRLLPFFRNLLPFVAGIIHTDFKQFFLFDLIWLVVLIGGEIGMGIFFGNISRVKNNISLVTIALVMIMILWPLLVKRIYSYIKK